MHVEAVREPLGERGLARAEVARQHEDVARTGQLGELGREGTRVVDRLRTGEDHEPSAFLARTRSARICAIGSAPPRRTAAGWNVGTSTPRRNGYV